MKNVLFPIILSTILMYHFAILDSTNITASEMRRVIVEVDIHQKTHRGLYHFMRSGRYNQNISLNGVEIPESEMLLWCEKKEEQEVQTKAK